MYQEEIKRAVLQLRLFNPEKIILYGSGAQGTVRNGSDLDFLIIKPMREPFLKRNVAAASYLDIAVSYDVFVVTPEEFDNGIRTGNPFLVEVARTGKTVYAK